MVDNANLKAVVKVKLTKIDENGNTTVEEQDVELPYKEALELWQSQQQH